MTTTQTGHGHCLCGKVKITANTMSKSVGACHCKTCRRWGGGPFMTVDCQTDVAFESPEYIHTYDSSEWAERGFCRHCGNHLFYKLKESGQYFMPVGLFEDDDSLIFDHQVFIDEKPDYYCFSNKTKDMTGAEIFAMFAPG